MGTLFKFLVFRPNLQMKLEINFSKNSNEGELSHSTDYCYFYILLKSKAIYGMKRNERYMFYQKYC